MCLGVEGGMLGFALFLLVYLGMCEFVLGWEERLGMSTSHQLDTLTRCSSVFGMAYILI